MTYNVGVTLALKRLRKIINEAIETVDSLIESLPEGELRAYTTAMGVNLYDALNWLVQCEICINDGSGGEKHVKA